MARWRRAVELAMTGEEIETLRALSRSRTEPASRVSRAAMLLAYREQASFFAVGQRLGVHHQTTSLAAERITRLEEPVHIGLVECGFALDAEVGRYVGEIVIDVVPLCRQIDPVKIADTLRLDESRDRA